MVKKDYHPRAVQTASMILNKKVANYSGHGENVEKGRHWKRFIHISEESENNDKYLSKLIVGEEGAGGAQRGK